MNTDSNLSSRSWWVDWNFYHFLKNSLFIKDSYFVNVTITLSADLCLAVYFMNSECFASSWIDSDNYFRFNLSNNWKSRPDCVLLDYSRRIDFHLTNANLIFELSILLMIVDCTAIITCLKLSCSSKYSFHLANDILSLCCPCIFSMTLFNFVCLLISRNDYANMHFLMTVAICYAAYSFLTLLSCVCYISFSLLFPVIN